MHLAGTQTRHQGWGCDRTNLPPEVQRPLPEGAGRVELATRLPDLTHDVASAHFPDAVTARARQIDLLRHERDGGVFVPDRQPCIGRVPQAVTPAPRPWIQR